MAAGALEKTIVPLRVKQALFVKTCTLELVIHICRDHEIILVYDQGKQVLINRLRSIDITIEIDVPCPPCPAGFLILKWIKTAGVHVPDTEAFLEIEEIPVEPLPAVGEACSSGKAGTRADHNSVGPSKLIL